MEDDSILEPIDMYKTMLKDKQHENAIKYFEELTQKSGINVEENKMLVKELRKIESEELVAQKNLNKIKGIKTALLVFSAIFIAIGFVFIANGLTGSSSKVVKIIVGALLLCVAIYFLIHANSAVKKKQKSREEELQKIIKKKNDKLDECYRSMAPLNRLYDWNIPHRIINKTTPMLSLDDYFDVNKYEYLHEKFGFEENTNPNSSTNLILTGEIEGNPFMLVNSYNMNMVNKTYEGHKIIHWTTTVHTKNGTRTQHHTQDLVAYVTKPAPSYFYDTKMIYACDAAPNLVFSRQPSGTKGLSEKEIEKMVKKGDKELDKMSERAIKNGQSFQRMGNEEFDVLFGAYNRNNELEYRLLFTPLAQRNMVKLVKAQEPYGDDFSFYKNKKLNYVTSQHSQKFNYEANPNMFVGYEYEKVKENFVNYNDEYFKSMFFDLAPLLSIPLYQQTKTHEFIYDIPYCANITSYEHEIIANRYNSSLLKHPESITNQILKTKFAGKDDKTDKVLIEARAFKGVKHVDIVEKLGGDGKIHGVPVEWIEYIPVSKETPMEVRRVDSSRSTFESSKNCDQFKEFVSKYVKNNAIIYERGLMSMLLDVKPSNEDLEKFKTLITDKGED